MAAYDTTLTDAARAELQDELDTLRAQRADLVDDPDDQRAEDVGDHAESLRRADDVSRIDDRIQEIIRLLSGTGPGAGEHPASPELPEGSEVTLRYDDGAEETLRVVATAAAVAEEELDTVLTLDSPLGKALAERGGKDTVGYEGPDGPRTATLLSLTTPS
jgi:transcription elongation GreA/GreB family factor